VAGGNAPTKPINQREFHRRSGTSAPGEKPAGPTRPVRPR
jgi:hypothetical protein